MCKCNSNTVPGKCKLTVPRNSNDSTRSSILETRKFRVLRFESRASSFESKSLIEVLEKFLECLETRNSILETRSSKLDPRNSILETRASKLDARFSKTSRIEDRVSSRDCQLTFARYCMFPRRTGKSAYLSDMNRYV